MAGTRAGWGLLAFLVGLDLLLILLHVGHAATWLRVDGGSWLAEDRWWLGSETGVAEAVQALKVLGVLGLLGWRGATHGGAW